MESEGVAIGDALVIQVSGLDELIKLLAGDGYRVIGPTIADGAIVYDEIRDAAQLPEGWTDLQQPGSYQLQRRDDGAVFGFAVGPHSWKKFLHVPVLRLWSARRQSDGSIGATADPQPASRFAFIGVRSCELHAIAIQDKVLIGGTYKDPHYAARRDGAFIVAVNCTSAGGTCFCVSMGTGPRAAAGFDLALTELLDGGRHEFLVEVGSARGADLIVRVAKRPAQQQDRDAAAQASAQAAAQMGRELDTDGVRELLLSNLEHPRWDDVAARCLACGNCTMVCPTCFCTTVEDHPDLASGIAERVRTWDSCYTLEFSHLHGGSVRSSIKSRYRQWLTHKIATWWDQFGTSGCVGCGRCITWCPVGIDLTEEISAIRNTAKNDGHSRSSFSFPLRKGEDKREV
jgi:sulfhydrogenase subunit beta (sulfur reductase)